MKEMFTTHTEADTIALGEDIASRLQRNGVVALVGDLGAGKTRFAKGICRGLGVTEHVASPTFTIVNEYAGRDLSVFHFDFYRLRSAAELHEIGFEEYLDRGGICIIEWADRVPEVLPATRIDVHLDYGEDENDRTILLETINGDAG
jgi:tRNA threonylcarbamoyladenosine biosynthesis protein TsaE